MTNKEIAERLRKIMNMYSVDKLQQLANELDPPRPEPGTVVWWRYPDDGEWFPGVAKPDGVEDHSDYPDWDEIEWKPARILAPDEVAVKVPPVSEWPNEAFRIDSEPYYRMQGWSKKTIGQYVTLITRAEAESMEADR